VSIVVILELVMPFHGIKSRKSVKMKKTVIFQESEANPGNIGFLLTYWQMTCN